MDKRFICGFGWSGSGAVYDAVRHLPWIVEFPNARPVDGIHPDALSEIPFIQSFAGLGHVWRQAYRHGRVSRSLLWDLLRCHIAGLAAMSYSEYKAANAARSFLARFGVTYVRIYRQAFERIELFGKPALSGYTLPLGELLITLQDLTDNLCRSVAGETGNQCMLFNNAVVCRNIDMLDIFTNVRAVAVTRDPKDIFVDRSRNDPNHWRDVMAFATFYEEGIKAFRGFSASTRFRHSGAVWLVRFEDFVLCPDQREAVLDWLTPDWDGAPEGRGFDPERSRQNIGIYEGQLSRRECRTLAALDDISVE